MMRDLSHSLKDFRNGNRYGQIIASGGENQRSVNKRGDSLVLHASNRIPFCFSLGEIDSPDCQLTMGHCQNRRDTERGGLQFTPWMMR
jgi:hypothetical protein